MHAFHPIRTGRGSRRSERCRQNDLVAHRGRTAASYVRADRCLRQQARLQCGPAGQGGLRRSGRTHYTGLSVADHLRLGAHTNPGWDRQLAEDRISKFGLDPSEGRNLSGGQRAQLALTLAIAKRPELLILDEPVSSLDPLARREFLQNLMAYVAEHGGSVILSSNLVSDLERVCDLIVLAASRVRVAGEVEDLLAH